MHSSAAKENTQARVPVPLNYAQRRPVFPYVGAEFISAHPRFSAALFSAPPVAIGTYPWHTQYAHDMAARTRRTHVLLPHDLLREIDAIAGPRGRTTFLVESAREAVRRKKLLRFLESPAAVWHDRDHPEMKSGAAAWVHRLRKEKRGARRRRNTSR